MRHWSACAGEVPADEYWPVLLGEHFRPMEHMEFVWRWRRRWQEIAFALDQPVELLEDERTYHPEALDTRGAILSLPPEERGDGDLSDAPAYAQVWALGFMYAVESWPQDWLPPRNDEAAEMLDAALEDIVALTEGDSGEPALSMYADDGPPSVSEERLDALAAGIWAVYTLRQVWRSAGSARGPDPQEPAARAQRPVPLRQRKEIQEVPRSGVRPAFTNLGLCPGAAWPCRSGFPELPQVQRPVGTEPVGVVGVVLEIVPAQAVHEHVEAAAVFVEPGHDAVELRRRECKLATPARMRPHQLLVNAPYRDLEPAPSLFAQGTRLLDGAGVEVHVGVVGGMDVDGAARHGAIVARYPSSDRMETGAAPQAAETIPAAPARTRLTAQAASRFIHICGRNFSPRYR